MILRSVAAQNFRNLAAASIEFHPHTNIIVGRNGQGKTNLLEAIYFLATTKSFRTPRIASTFRFAAETVFVSGALQREVERTLSVGLETGEQKRRVLMINGERVSLHDYLKAMTVFAYSSARLDILRGTPEDRRRFLDRGVASVDPGYLAMLTRFSRVLKQRNALLQSGTPTGLDAWDAEFSEAAGAIQKSRANYVDALRIAFTAINESFSIKQADFAYKPSAVDLDRRRDELRAGMSLSGPQRDNVEFTVEGRTANEVLSGGEQKMIVLLLKFAKLQLFRARQSDDAVFLLDDLDAELDLEILHKLLSGLPLQTQVFATSAKHRLVDEIATGAYRLLFVENGAVTSVEDFA